MTRTSPLSLRDESSVLRSKISTLELSEGKGRYSKYNFKAFTERGLYMLATILKSKRAEDATIAIIETFAKKVEIRNNLSLITHHSSLLTSDLRPPTSYFSPPTSDLVCPSDLVYPSDFSLQTSDLRPLSSSFFLHKTSSFISPLPRKVPKSFGVLEKVPYLCTQEKYLTYGYKYNRNKQ